ncbi:MAG: hypothetical protein IPK77_16795 [Cellvibrio sp.]|nr:hypothetical protein [Cellvibrio sp.]
MFSPSAVFIEKLTTELALIGYITRTDDFPGIKLLGDSFLTSPLERVTTISNEYSFRVCLGEELERINNSRLDDENRSTPQVIGNIGITVTSQGPNKYGSVD